MSDTFSLGLVQMSIPNDAVASVEKAVAGIGEAAKAGAQIVVLPELFRTPYFCQRQHADLFDLAEPIPGPTYAAVANAAKSEK